MKKEPIKKNNINRPSVRHTPAFIIFLIVIGAIALIMIISRSYMGFNVRPENPINKLTDIASVDDIKPFASAEEFKNYIVKAGEMSGANAYVGGMGMMKSNSDISRPAMGEIALDNSQGLGSAPSASPEANRISETNVQVVGIDEPDIVKTDGKNIFFSQENNGIMPYYDAAQIAPMPTAKIMPPRQSQSVTNIIKAWPATDLEFLTKIEQGGELLLADNILVIFNNNYGSDRGLVAYDVSDSTKPSKKWSIKYADSNYLLSARLYDGQIYLVTQNSLNDYSPCPIKPLTLNDQAVEIACSSIYHPITVVPMDSTFIGLNIDIKSGEIKNKVSFVGLSGQSVVYMSPQAIYVTYQQATDVFGFLYDFYSKKMTDLVPADLIAKLAKVKDYDISQNSKMSEFYNVLSKWQNSLSNDDQLKLNTETENRATKYFDENKRKLLNTGLVKIALPNLKIVASGSVPGTPLNQFALDEYKGYLRLATTVGENWWGLGSGQNSANDVYVLDKNLKVSGSVQDLGLTERIYSVRFIEDKAYLVTFRQTDPFYVLDLSKPSKPELKGELKIPGFSSYLHPIDKDKIVGVGQENSKVKISLFDVSDPSQPKEIDKYSLDEYWTEVSNNHHAFLMDTKHQIFFLPGGQGGYILSYKDDKLSLDKAVKLDQVKRAIYLNDYLYVIATGDVKVFDENTWEEVKALSLPTN